MSSLPDRRSVLSLGLIALMPFPALASEAEAGFVHRGFTVNMGATAVDRREPVAASIRQQIDQVESLSIRDDIKAWFRSVRITVDPSLNMAGRFGRAGLTLNDAVAPRDNPVLLHELLHGYQAQRLQGGGNNPTLVEALQQAKASDDWPANAYMLSNINEFFAMTASVALWGRAARPPGTRERLRAAMPGYYGWLADEFGLAS